MSQGTMDALWITVYGQHVLDTILLYDISESGCELDGGNFKIRIQQYGINKNGLVITATHRIDTSQQVGAQEVYRVDISNNRCQHTNLPKYKTVENQNFAQRVFNIMKERYNKPQKLEVAENVK